MTVLEPIEHTNRDFVGSLAKGLRVLKTFNEGNERMTVSDVDNLVRNIISHNDVGARLITRSGYSIGIAFPPSWDEGYICSLKQGDSTVLRKGMTFHIIPWMWGVDGSKTCGISDTIFITENGCESFFTLDQSFVVKPEEADKTSQSKSNVAEVSNNNLIKAVAKTGVISKN